MNRFLKHGPCDSCGSPDNNAFYEDGHSYCFGCRKYIPGKVSIHKVHNPSLWIDNKAGDFPHDATSEIPHQPLKWLLQYGITQQQANKHNIFWSPFRQCLAWRVYNPEGTIIGWVSRNFSKTSKVKSNSYGKIHADVNVLGNTKSEFIVLVEDYISAIKVSPVMSCMALYGCTISLDALQALSKRFKGVILWLDSDKLDNARKIALRANLSGLTGKVLYTELDPKCYSTNDIKKYLAILS